MDEKKGAWLKTRSIVGGSLAFGVLCGGEVAWNAISGAIGHPIGPQWGGIGNPLDGLRALGTVEQYCAFAAHPGWAESFNPVAMANPAHRVVAHALCRLPQATVNDINLKSAVAFSMGAIPLLGLQAQKWFKNAQGPGRVLPRVKPGPGHVVVKVGRSTGIMAAAGLTEAGLAPGQDVCITDKDLRAHVLMCGQTGIGKTSQGIVVILRQLMAQGCGGIIANAKSTFHHIVLQLGEETGRDVQVIGIGAGADPVDFCADMSVEMAKTYLGAILRTTDRGKDSDTWINSAVNFARGGLGLLKVCEIEYPDDPSHFSYPDLFQYLYPNGRNNFGIEIAEKITAKMKEWGEKFNELPEGDEREAIDLKMREVESYQSEFEMYARLSEGQKTSVDISLRQILSVLATPAVTDAFFNKKKGKEKGKRPFSFEQTCNGSIFVINAMDGDSAKIVVGLAKQMWAHAMEQRLIRDDLDRETLVVGVFDEYQDYIVRSGDRADHKVNAKLREMNAMMLCATQSVSSLAAELNNEHITNTLIQNFGTRVIWHTKDIKTQDDAIKLFGTVEVERETTSRNTQPGRFVASKGTSKGTQRQATADAQLFLNLKGNQALIVTTLFRDSAVDIITTTPDSLA